MKKIQLLAAAFLVGSVFSSTSLIAQDGDGDGTVFGPGGDVVVVDPDTGEDGGIWDETAEMTIEDIEAIFGPGSAELVPEGFTWADLEALTNADWEAYSTWGDDFPGGGDGTIGDGDDWDWDTDGDGIPDGDDWGDDWDDEGNGGDDWDWDWDADGDGIPDGDGWDPGDGLDWEWDWDDDGVIDDPIGDEDEPLTAEDIEAIFGPGAELPDGFTWGDLGELTDEEWAEYITFEIFDWEELSDEELEELFGDDSICIDGGVFGVPGGIDEEWFDEDFIIDFEEELTDEEIEELIGEETYVFTEEDIEELYEEFISLFGDDFITYEEFLDGFAGFLGTEASERLSSALSIDESAVANFNVYPNPATDVLNVDLALNDGNTASIVVTNLAGQTVYALNNVNSKQTIQLDGLTAGIYTVRLTVAQKDVQVLKFVKQ